MAMLKTQGVHIKYSTISLVMSHYKTFPSKWPGYVSIRVYSFPNNLLEADPHGYLRELWWFRSRLLLCHPGFLSAWVPGLAAHRAAPSVQAVPAHWPPYINATGRRADSTDSSHYYGPARKSSPRGHRDARMPARFFRFPRGPSIYLAACKEKKKERMRLFMLCARWPGKAQRIEVYPVTEGRFFTNCEKLKWVKTIWATRNFFFHLLHRILDIPLTALLVE